MVDDGAVDYYETLQVSANADPETIHRIYRLLAQRFHPDNKETGNANRFREITEAYHVLGDPERRAQYDVVHRQLHQKRWRLVAKATEIHNDFELEQLLRLTVLEVLYTKRRLESDAPGIFMTDLEELTGTPREHLEFTVWYLVQKLFIQRSDNSRLVITATGADFLEQHYQANPLQRRLRASNEVVKTATESA